MTKIIDDLKDAVQVWLAGLKNKDKSPEPRKALYQGVEVFVHSKSKYYAIISYSETAERMFSIPLSELK